MSQKLPIVLSVTALIVAVLGTTPLGHAASAALVLGKNSVGSAQLQSNSVNGSKVQNGSLTGADIRNRSLTAADFKGSLPSGAAGATGPTGPAGPQGTPGTQGTPGLLGSAIVRRTDVALPAGAGAGVPGVTVSGFAKCAGDEKIIGGSVNISSATLAEALISRPSVDNAGTGAVPGDGEAFAFWKGTGRTTTNVAGTMRVFAICAKA